MLLKYNYLVYKYNQYYLLRKINNFFKGNYITKENVLDDLNHILSSISNVIINKNP